MATPTHRRQDEPSAHEPKFEWTGGPSSFGELKRAYAESQKELAEMRWQYAILARAKRSLRTDFKIEHDLRMMQRKWASEVVDEWRLVVHDLEEENGDLRAEVRSLRGQLMGEPGG